MTEKHQPFSTTAIGARTERARFPLSMRTDDPAAASEVVGIVAGLGDPAETEAKGSPTPLVIETIGHTLLGSASHHAAVAAEGLPSAFPIRPAVDGVSTEAVVDVSDRMAGDPTVKYVRHLPTDQV